MRKVFEERTNNLQHSWMQDGLMVSENQSNYIW